MQSAPLQYLMEMKRWAPVHNVFRGLEVSACVLWRIFDSPFLHQVFDGGII